jgi:hypothetical protein
MLQGLYPPGKGPSAHWIRGREGSRISVNLLKKKKLPLLSTIGLATRSCNYATKEIYRPGNTSQQD